jgi:putative GTP pyrophosphokinase
MPDIRIDQFTEQYSLYDAFRVRLYDLLRTLMSERDIDVHLIESRTKTIKSFSEKISRPGKSYGSKIDEVADLCGCRIITYYQDDCEKVATLLKGEFLVKEEELSHQPNALAADRFGYISAHYIVSMSKQRAKLTEWQPYKNLKAEIQVRTVIQHAWSAVSHAVQYKEEAQVPSKLQRRLNRIAGLFELADEEFMGIRDQRLLLREQAGYSLAIGDTSIPLTSASIEKFIESWPGMKEATEKAAEAGFVILSSDADDSYVADIYKFATKNELRTVAELGENIRPLDAKILRSILEEFYGDGKMNSWEVTHDFLVYLLLINRFIDKITVEDLIADGWDPKNAAAVKAALQAQAG